MVLLQAGGLLGTSDDASQVQAEIAALEQRLDGEIVGLRGEFEATDGAASTPADEGAVVALRGELAAISSRIAEIETGLADVTQADTAALIAQNAEQLEAFRADLDALRTAQEENSGALASRLEAVETELAAPGADELVARAIAAAGLKSAIDRGGPFAPELQAYAAMAPDDAAVTALDGFAEAGVPTHSALAERFPDVARAILQAERGGTENSVIDRLWSSARSVVTVRQTGDVEGDTTEAIVARIESRLNEGQLQAALDEWETLAEAGKAASSDFAHDLRARVEADAIVAQTLSSAMQQTTN
jgi:hypothetical protein